MSEFTVIEKVEGKKYFESIVLKPNSLTGFFSCYSGLQGDYWVSIIPSMNVTGYGETMEESRESLRENLEILCDDLFELTKEQRILELKKMGWEKHKFFNKRFSKSYVDENGVLQDFDHPEQVRKSYVQAV